MVGVLATFAIVGLSLVLNTAWARPPGAPGLNDTGFRGLDEIGFPVAGEEVSGAATAGYGLTESVGDLKGLHHRVTGKLGVAATLVPNLTFGLLLDGRIDIHPSDDMGSDGGAVGEPSLIARYGTWLGEDIVLGGELVVTLPGGTAPSLKLSATTFELRALLALLQLRPVSLHGVLGFRLNNSAHSAPDLNRLRPGDRVSLGLSDRNQLVAGLGAHVALSATLSAFAEATMEPLLGKVAFGTSPMRLSLGVRHAFTDTWSFEAKTRLALNRRPSIEPDAPLVPIEPRLAVSIGLRYAFDTSAPPPSKFVTPDEFPAASDRIKVPELTAGSIRGVLTDELGEAIAGATVTFGTSDGQFVEATTDDRGRYSFEDVAFGPVSAEAIAERHQPAHWQFEHSSETTGLAAPVTLRATGPVGQLRGLIRSWSSTPLPALVTILSTSGEHVAEGTANANGRLVLDLPEGTYQVRVSADGFRSQKRRVRIRDRGVTILNVDLRGR